jgi:CheY-like chemotaxis protein
MCGSIGISGPAGRPLRVLIVEDEAIVADDLAYMLGAAGAQVIGIAAGQRDAVRLGIEHYPDVVLMDIRLRGGDDGIVAAEAIRAVLGTPIIFCTGNGDPETRRRVEAFGGAELLLKPIDGEPLIEAIGRVCCARSCPSKQS